MQYSTRLGCNHFLTAMTDQLFEGCLLLDDLDKKYLSEPSDLRKEDKKTHITYKDKMWSSEIPYVIFFTGKKRSREGNYTFFVSNLADWE